MKKLLVSLILAAVGLIFTLGYGITTAQVPEIQPIQTVSSGEANLKATDPAEVMAQAPALPPNFNAALNPIDMAFMMEASLAGNGNMMLGQLALQRAGSEEAREFAQAEINEQMQIKNDLSQIAPRLGVTLPQNPAPKFEAAMAQLSQLSGRRFDSAYMNEGGVNAHLENAALFQREAAFGRNPDLVALANRGLPIINRHFDIASDYTDYQFARVSQRFNDPQNISDALTPQRDLA
uniref:Outer membrane protein n=1 Tax=Cyanothece sp. (strain PCC 7425 / ATCC 29141) TaxID=395961 RepID=B8HK99_CYAP4